MKMNFRSLTGAAIGFAAVAAILVGVYVFISTRSSSKEKEREKDTVSVEQLQAQIAALQAQVTQPRAAGPFLIADSTGGAVGDSTVPASSHSGVTNATDGLNLPPKEVSEFAALVNEIPEKGLSHKITETWVVHKLDLRKALGSVDPGKYSYHFAIDFYGPPAPFEYEINGDPNKRGVYPHVDPKKKNHLANNPTIETLAVRRVEPVLAGQELRSIYWYFVRNAKGVKRLE